MFTLSIGMATYDDYDGVFFTIQSLRMHHPFCSTNNVEYIVLDTNPKGNHSSALKSFLEGSVPNSKYITQTDNISSFNKYNIVDYANGKYILILDCHILLASGALDSLLTYYNDNPNCKDLIQGPLLYDDLQNYATEFKDEWRGDMYGTWHSNHKAYSKGEPFEIKMQGMGLCSFEKQYWPGISKHFKGFGGEEGYIAEKFRRNGGKNICLPQLKWVHRFGRPNGVKYPLILEDRVWNYFVGWLEITQDPNHPMITDTYNHFSKRLSQTTLDQLLQQAIEKTLPVH